MAGERLGELTQGPFRSFALGLSVPGVPIGFLLAQVVGVPLERLGVRVPGGSWHAATVIACNAGCFAWTAWALQRGPRSRRVVVLLVWAAWAVLVAAWLSRVASD